jgi:hypothetical protein
MGAERASNNTGELNGMGQGLLWVRDKDDTDDAAVFLYDSMYAAHGTRPLEAEIVSADDSANTDNP